MASITEFYNQGFYNPGHRYFSIQLHQLGREASARITRRTKNSCGIIMWMMDLYEECLKQTFYADFIVCLLDKQGLPLNDDYKQPLYPTPYWRIYMESKKLEIDLAIAAVLKEYGGILNQPGLFNNMNVLKIRAAKTCLGVAFDRNIPIEDLIQKVTDQLKNMENDESMMSFEESPSTLFQRNLKRARFALDLPFGKSPLYRKESELDEEEFSDFDFAKPHKNYKHCITEIFGIISDSESPKVSRKTQNDLDTTPLTETTDIDETSADSERILARKKRRCRKRSLRKETIFHLDFKLISSVPSQDPEVKENLDRLTIGKSFEIQPEIYNEEFPSLIDFGYTSEESTERRKRLSESDQAYMGSDEQADSDN